MLIRGMLGFGDNIYQRAFIRQMPGIVYLETPWPELYADLPGVRCVRPQTRLRTQRKNIERRKKWAIPPRGLKAVSVGYDGAGIYAGMQRSLRVAPGPLDLPDLGQSPLEGPYIVVRPVTVRAEWRADARNPRPEYVAAAAAELRRRGYRVVSVADLEQGQEWALDPLPAADIRFHQGELNAMQLLALVRGATAVVGGIGWIVPASIAAAVPAWIVCGGQGGYNAPELITAPAMNAKHITFAVPGNFCRCTQKQHSCDKRIPNYDRQFAEWADRLPPVV